VWAVAAASLLVPVAAFWWLSEAQKPSGATPRLVADKTEVDLGDFPFDKMARAVFTLTNGGEGPLKILDVSPVRALQGC
jgi:hypothetical protein